MISRTIWAARLGLLTAAAIATSSVATAQSVAPMDQRIDLGGQQGDVYATVRPDGMHVLATFAEPAESALPVRVETVLAPIQTVTVFSPRGTGEPANGVAITRHGNHVQLYKVPEVD